MVPTHDASRTDAGTEVARHHPRWAWGSLVATPSAVMVAGLVPLAAWVAAQIGALPLLGVWTLAAVLLLRTVRRQRPALSIAGDTAVLTLSSGGPAVDTVTREQITELRVLDRTAAAALVASASVEHPHLDTRGFTTLPAEDGPGHEPAALLIATGQGPHRLVRLWPVWRPQQAQLLVAQLTSPGPGGPRQVAVELPARTDPPPPAWREIARTVWWRAGLVALVAVAAGAMIRLLSAVLRAMVMDPVLATRLGPAVSYATRWLELVVVVAGAIGGLVAAGIVLAWGARGAGPRLASIWRLAAWRTGWALWQLKLWLIGTAGLQAVLGVAGQRVVLSVATASVAIPAVQLTRELARRTVEETRGARPAMVRISRAPQLLPLAAAVVAVLALRT